VITQVRIIRPQVEVSFVPALGLQVSGLTTELALNQPPVISFDAQPANVKPDKALTLLSSDVTRQLGRLQTRFFSDVANTLVDAQFTIKDGSTTLAVIKGKLGSGNYGWGIRAPNMPHHAVGAVGALSALRFSCYEPKRQLRDKPTFLSEDFKPNKNLCLLIKAIAEKLRSRADATIIGKTVGMPNPAVAQEEYASAIKMNERVLPIFFEILSNAAVEFDELADATFLSAHRLALDQTISTALLSTTDGFEAIQNLCASFGLAYVPSMANSGKLVRLDKLLDGAPRDMILDAVNLDATISSRGHLPVRAVRVIAPTSSYYGSPPKDRAAGTSSYGGMRVFAQYPAEAFRQNTVGTLKTVPPPPWISVDPQSAVTPIASADSLTDLNSLSKVIENHTKKLTGLAEVTLRSLTAWAKLQYIQEVLSATGLIIEMPVTDWTPLVGQQVACKSADGAELFRGLVVKETRALSGAGEEASARAVFHLSYVRFNGFDPSR